MAYSRISYALAILCFSGKVKISPDNDACCKADGSVISGSGHEVLQHEDICSQIIILYIRGRIQSYVFTFWHRRGSSTYARPTNWEDEGIWFCQIFITSRGGESYQGNGWQDSTRKIDICGDGKRKQKRVGHPLLQKIHNVRLTLSPFWQANRIDRPRLSVHVLQPSLSFWGASPIWFQSNNICLKLVR